MLTITDLIAIEDSFWSKVNHRGPDECWPWNKSHDDDGYGHLAIRDSTGKRHYPKANRVAWELANRRMLPRGQQALHNCDSPSCCNPRHIFPGTHGNNMKDMTLKRRAAYGRRNGTYTRLDRRAIGSRNGARLHPERLARGEAHPGSKLTEQDVREIVEHYRAGESQRALAKRYGANQSTLSAILSGRTWTKITGGVPVRKGQMPGKELR